MTKQELEQTIVRLNINLEQLTQMLRAQSEQLKMQSDQLVSQSKQIKTLLDLIKAKDEEIARLKEQNNKNSQNSSKPPSSDGYKKPAPKSTRKKTGKKQGAQRGHEGHHLSVNSAQQIYVEHMPTACQNCPHSEECRKRGNVCASRRVIDLQVVTIETVHQQIMIPKCPHHTELRHLKGEFPEGVNAPIQYGEGLKSFAVTLSTYGAVSLQRIHEIISGIFSISLSTGTIVSMVHQCAQKIQGTLEGIRKQLIASPVLHCDETGGRINGGLNWIHYNGTSLFSLLSLEEKRGSWGMDACGILPLYTGIAVHDCWRSYWKYSTVKHAICNAHILRELNGIIENYPEQTWAVRFRNLLCGMKKVADQAIREGKTRLSDYHRRKHSRLYDEIIQEALAANPLPERDPHKRGRIKLGPIRTLIERLRINKGAVCLFATNLSVPFDNNLAERGLRMTKAKFKIAGCFRSSAGCQDYLDIMSYVDSAKKHGKSAYEAIHMAITGISEQLFLS